jgi:ectoine hydroxylase-related dioxygenase (phytanoyl-CoA dioxygenase family)
MTKRYLRQEANVNLSVDMDVMKKYPVDIQKVAGYSLSEPFLGWVDSTDPRKLLDPTILDYTDMWTGAEEPDDF